MAVRDKIYPTDTYPIALECRKPDPDRPNDSRGLPTTPLSATARVLDTSTGEFLPIGGVGIFSDVAAVVPQTGVEPTDDGAVISYVVSADFTQLPGDFVLFIQAVFGDGYVLTTNRQYKVIEYS